MFRCCLASALIVVVVVQVAHAEDLAIELINPSATLCPGDSGGPIFSSDGPAPRQQAVSVNSEMVSSAGFGCSDDVTVSYGRVGVNISRTFDSSGGEMVDVDGDGLIDFLYRDRVYFSTGSGHSSHR